MSVEFVIGANRGLVVAPAGCGKTHLIVDALKVATSKPVLVLTHTTAGVSALKRRLRDNNVPSDNFRVYTIDGWATRLVNWMPKLCPVGVSPSNTKLYYPELRRKVYECISAGHINSALRSTYSRLLVDEYQDCSDVQHEIIQAINNLLPTVVFGDPMQSIFNLGNTLLPNWTEVVEVAYPERIVLDRPWRWENAGSPELGRWILDARQVLKDGNKLDYKAAFPYVSCYFLTGEPEVDLRNQIQVQYEIRRKNPKTESLLVIGDSINKKSRYKFSQRANGLDVVEPVDMEDILGFAKEFDLYEGRPLLDSLLLAASSVMTGVDRTVLSRRIATIMKGNNRSDPDETEKAAVDFLLAPTKGKLSHFVKVLEQKPGVRVYRAAAFSFMKDFIEIASCSPEKKYYDSALLVRERRRYTADKRVSHYAIGSTLLLKGLEADHVLILNAANMNPENLYVALSRGARSVSLFM